MKNHKDLSKKHKNQFQIMLKEAHIGYYEKNPEGSNKGIDDLMRRVHECLPKNLAREKTNINQKEFDNLIANVLFDINPFLLL